VTLDLLAVTLSLADLPLSSLLILNWSDPGMWDFRLVANKLKISAFGESNE
jgi:hypothetical protein